MYNASDNKFCMPMSLVLISYSYKIHKLNVLYMHVSRQDSLDRPERMTSSIAYYINVSGLVSWSSI